MKSILHKYLQIVRSHIVLLLLAILYFGLLVITLVTKIQESGVTINLIQMAVVVCAFAIGSFMMSVYSKNKLKKTHMPQGASEVKYGMTGGRKFLDQFISLLFLLTGVLFMVLTLL